MVKSCIGSFHIWGKRYLLSRRLWRIRPFGCIRCAVKAKGKFLRTSCPYHTISQQNVWRERIWLHSVPAFGICSAAVCYLKTEPVDGSAGGCCYCICDPWMGRRCKNTSVCSGKKEEGCFIPKHLNIVIVTDKISTTIHCIVAAHSPARFIGNSQIFPGSTQPTLRRHSRVLFAFFHPASPVVDSIFA